MKHCHECGAEIKDQAKFCPKCGAAQGIQATEDRVSEDTESAVTEAVSAGPAQEPQVQAHPQEQPQAPVQPAPTPTPQQPLLNQDTLEAGRSYLSHFFESLSLPGFVNPEQPPYYSWLTLGAFILSTYLFFWSVGSRALEFVMAFFTGRLNDNSGLNFSSSPFGTQLDQEVTSALGEAISRFTFYLALILLVMVVAVYLVKRFMMAMAFRFTHALQRVAAYLPAYIVVMLFYALFGRLMPLSLLTAQPVLMIVFTYFLLLPAMAIWTHEALAVRTLRWYHKLYYIAMTYALIFMMVGIIIAVVR